MQKEWNGLDLDLIWIDIGVFKNFKECACLPCNGNHFSSISICMYINNSIDIYLLCMIKVGLGGVVVVCGECYNLG